MTKQSEDLSYPLAENDPEQVVGGRGLNLDQITMDGVLSGKISMEDLRITSSSLLAQASIARAAGRTKLAANFERAAEMVSLSSHEIFEIYELLRPGRARSPADLMQKAQYLREARNAKNLSEVLEEAATVYEKRELFNKRF